MSKRYHSRLKLLASQAAPTPAEFQHLKTKFPALPNEYLQWNASVSEQELELDGKNYIRLWRPSGCVEMYDAYPFVKYIPEAIPVGDDGGGNALAYLLTGPAGSGLYKISFGNIGRDDAVFLAPSLDDFLGRGVGLDKI